ncbi:MAG: ABC transporter ATP-binding protein [Chloroflexi bacterium]|nr:ABC transporter ATP-binding protein [Chloroflexota bacterium]
MQEIRTAQQLREALDLPPRESQPLVKAEGLTRLFPINKSIIGRARSYVHAVDDVSFALARGESLALVGESGSGKTTIGRLLLKLVEPTAGRVLFHDGGEEATDVSRLRGKRLRAFRRRAQMIFQDPYESMNPRRTIFDTVGEPLAVQRMGGIPQRLQAVSEILEAVGLTPASSYMFRYPHELSGGQRQRVAIARALVVKPSFVVADEPTSMLDMSIRAGIIRLMTDLAQRREITYLYITHDLAVARYMSDHIAVMYMGKIVETGETEEILKSPLHPYTRALLSAIPVPDPTHRRAPVQIGGSAARPIDPPARCRFYDRCPLAVAFCREAPVPPLENKGNGHLAACYRV